MLAESLQSQVLPPNPYPGVRAFRRDEAHIFFGREDQIDGLLHRLGTLRLVAVAGESGCGKSSLVRAGLLPALDAGFLISARAQWRVADMRPGSEPLRNLAVALSSALTVEPSSRPDVDLLTARLLRGPLSIVELLREQPLPDDTELLVLVDQFEELVRFRSRIDTNEADAFVALLLATIAQPDLPVRVVITLRSDYLGECALFRGLPEILNGCQYLVPRLEREQLLEAIIAPARVFDGDVEPKLANRIVNEVGRSQDQLPVVEHALLWMWTRAKVRAAAAASLPGRAEGDPISLTMADYDALAGGLGEALSKHADEVYDSLADDAQRDIARSMFAALWDEHAQEADTRRPCSLREVADIAGFTEDQVRAVADVFRRTEHSLLMPPSDVPLQSDTILDVGHESLFRHWSRLKDWCRAEAKSAEQYRRWTGLARAWKAGNGDALTDRNLETAEAWSASTRPNAAWARRYSSEENDFDVLQAFLAESRAARTKRLVALRRARARLLIFSIASLLAVFSAVIVAAFLLASSRAKDRDVRRQRLALAAFNAARSEPVRALQLTMEANHFGGREAETALRKALRESQFRKIVIASESLFDDVQFLPDGRRIVTVGPGDGVAVWDVSTGNRELTLRGGDAQDQLAINRDGTLAATGGPEGTIDVWELSTGRLKLSLSGHAGTITDLAFSADGSRLASSSEDGTAAIWDVATGAQRGEFVCHLGTVKSVAFTHDSLMIATAGDDDRILFWDVTTGKKVRVLHRSDVDNVAFNSSGGLFAASSDSSVVIWDPITGRETGQLPHTNRVNAVAFSPDGTRIATASFDGTVRIWDAYTHEELSAVSDEPALSGPVATPTIFTWPPRAVTASKLGDPMERMVRRLSFSADGRQLVTSGLDGTAKVWSVDAGGEIDTFKAHDGSIQRVAFDRFRGRLASGGDDGTAAVWDERGHLLFRTPKDGAVGGVAFNRTGDRLAVANLNRISIWDVRARRLIKQIPMNLRVRDLRMFHRDNRLVASAGKQLFIWHVDEDGPPLEIQTDTTVVAVAVSPDDKHVASECHDHQICLWSTDTGERIATWPGSQEANADETDADPAAQAHSLPILDLAFSGDGKRVVSGSKDKSVKVWDVDSGYPMAVLHGHRETVSGVAISEDGLRVASTGADRALLWNADTRTLSDGFPTIERRSESVAFSPDEKRLVIGGEDGVIRIFSLDPESLTGLAADRVPFGFSDRMCRAYKIPDCRRRTSDAQLTNEARHLLHHGDDPRARLRLSSLHATTSTLESEAARFYGARLFAQARSNLVSEIYEALTAWAKAAKQGATTELVDHLQTAAHGAVATGRQALDQVRAFDPKTTFDSGELTSRIVRRAFFDMAKLAADAGNHGLGAELLALSISPQDPRFAVISRRLATGPLLTAAHEGIRENRPEDSLIALGKAALDPSDPQHISWLRLAATSLTMMSDKNRRAGATAVAAQNKQDAVKLCERAIASVTDPDVLVEVYVLLDLLEEKQIAERALEQALRLDPTHDEALYLRGLVLSAKGRPAAGVALLRKVSPLSRQYRSAIEVAGGLLYDRLKNADEGYQLMVLAAEGRNSSGWANLAEAAWATRRFNDARLTARRIIDARDVEPADPPVQLAMHFVLVATAAQTGAFAAARRELDELIAFAPLVKVQEWRYTGTRLALDHVKVRAEREFLVAVLDYTETLGKSPSADTLRSLLDKLVKTKHAD